MVLSAQSIQECVHTLLNFSLLDRVGRVTSSLSEAMESDVPAAPALDIASTAGSTPFTWQKLRESNSEDSVIMQQPRLHQHSEGSTRGGEVKARALRARRSRARSGQSRDRSARSGDGREVGREMGTLQPCFIPLLPNQAADHGTEGQQGRE